VIKTWLPAKPILLIFFRKFASKSSFEIASSALVSVSIAVVATSEGEYDKYSRATRRQERGTAFSSSCLRPIQAFTLASEGSCDFCEIARNARNCDRIFFPSTTINVFYTFIVHEIEAQYRGHDEEDTGQGVVAFLLGCAKWTMPPPPLLFSLSLSLSLSLPPSLPPFLSFSPPPPSTESNSNTT